MYKKNVPTSKAIDNIPVIVNVDTACRIYGISKGRLRKLADVPGSGCFHDGRCIKVHREVLDQYLKNLAANGEMKKSTENYLYQIK